MTVNSSDPTAALSKNGEHSLPNGTAPATPGAVITNGDNSTSDKVTDASTTGEAKIEAKPRLPRGSVCSLKQLVQHEKTMGDPTITERDNVKDDDDPYRAHAVVVKACYDTKNKLEKTTLTINSPHILKALKDVVTFYPSEPLDFEDGGSYEVSHPYMVLHHHYEALQEYANGDQVKEFGDAHDHLSVLLDFLEADGREARKLRDAKLVDFKHLWLIYKPGELLFDSQYGHDRLYRISHVGYNEHSIEGKYLGIRCTFTSCDGQDIGTAAEKLDIYERREFVRNTASPITSLSVYPLSFLGNTDDIDSIKASLVERGNRYLQITGIKVYQYEGLYMYLKSPPDDYYSECADYSGTWLPATTHGRIIVDAKTFSEEVKKKAEHIISYCRRSDDGINSNDSNANDGLDCNEADPLLAPPHVFGFCLESKQWSKFFVDSLNVPNWAANALESLVLPPQRKEVIESLVTAHQDHSLPPVTSQRPGRKQRLTSQARNEVMAKGKGLIVLLHGEPGSGKTLTAELMAEHTHRPLLYISTGSLGDWQYRVAYELKRLLTYASIWKAIVLIDECDVFLESRKSGPSDMLAQNALVAVFLRQLEYFQGIAFLTSNRIESFDPAVKSRIHLALKYDSPDLTVRKSLWRKKLEVLSSEEAEMDVPAVVEAVADADMNGREISNAVNTARTLAADKGVKLTGEHVSTVVTLWKEFEGAFNAKVAK